MLVAIEDVLEIRSLRTQPSNLLFNGEFKLKKDYLIRLIQADIILIWIATCSLLALFSLINANSLLEIFFKPDILSPFMSNG